MRYDKRYTRVLNMITAPEIPRMANGGIQLCRRCQRRISFAGGFLKYLSTCLSRAATRKFFENARKRQAV